ncbi:MAG: succinate--CoA ligase subunit alpha [Anaerolineae bacterium]|nr:succinate--CoA ligase subunit alpha [Anaerolineae bacterium]
MPILVRDGTRVLIQGITGRQGSFHTRLMLDYGTDVAGGVSPGKGGDWIEGLPIFDTVFQAVNATGANTSLILVPAAHAPDAIIEAVDAGIELIVCITEGIPVQDMLRVYQYVRASGSRLIGPNCPGILIPGHIKLGIIPAMIARRGHIGVVSRSGTLMYEVCFALSARHLGQSTIVGIGGDPVKGTGFIEILEMFENDLETEKVVLLGEIGGTEELEAAEYIQHGMTRPVIAFIAGESAPSGRRIGHAGAIVEQEQHTARYKRAALETAGAAVARTPAEIIDLIDS